MNANAYTVGPHLSIRGQQEDVRPDAGLRGQALLHTAIIISQLARLQAGRAGIQPLQYALIGRYPALAVPGLAVHRGIPMLPGQWAHAILSHGLHQ